eukprot:TRINITY_DN11270_c0_g1_i1.p1 TRINITY_DN11270_c0_g1~~TRINITY_DN11270_c0_g1_i1.p1  ORF type:complete len:152 (-),score=35.46 TRINITY_DN11270_c0_g1_i1:166-621(-)
MFRRLLNNFFISTRRQFVGKDLEGNSYYLIQTDKGEKRFMVPGKNVSADPADFSPIWRAWLHGIRREAPTIQELEYDKIMQVKVSELAKEVEKRDATEVAKLLFEKESQSALSKYRPSIGSGDGPMPSEVDEWVPEDPPATSDPFKEKKKV